MEGIELAIQTIEVPMEGIEVPMEGIEVPPYDFAPPFHELRGPSHSHQRSHSVPKRLAHTLKSMSHQPARRPVRPHMVLGSDLKSPRSVRPSEHEGNF